MGEQDSEQARADERRFIEEVLSELKEGIELKIDLQAAKARWTAKLAAIDLLREREKPLQVHVEYFVECFAIKAQWAMSAVSNEGRISGFYEPYLRQNLQPGLEKNAEHISANWKPDYVHRGVFLATLRGQLYARIEHWKAEAFEHVRKGVLEGESRLKHDEQQSADKPANAEAVTLEALQTAPQVPAKRATNGNGSSASWQTVEISFLSDERVQIRDGTNTETRNYGELGFADNRSKRGQPKPNQAWVTLRALAEQNGLIRNGVTTGAAWTKVEKRIQEIRKVLRKHFGIAADPVPFVSGTGYQALFKIGCSPSYDT